MAATLTGVKLLCVEEVSGSGVGINCLSAKHGEEKAVAPLHHSKLLYLNLMAF